MISGILFLILFKRFSKDQTVIRKISSGLVLRTNVKQPVPMTKRVNPFTMQSCGKTEEPLTSVMLTELVIMK